MPELNYIHLGAEWRIWVEAADEIGCADGWLAETLGGDPVIAGAVEDRVVQGIPPEGTAYPFVTFDYQSAEEDDRTMRSECARLIYLVRVVDRIDLGAAYDTASTVATAIKAVLQGAAADRNDGSIIRCLRVRPWRLEETKEA